MEYFRDAAVARKPAGLRRQRPAGLLSLSRTEDFGPGLFDLYASGELIVDGPLLDQVYRPYVRLLDHAYDDVSQVSRRALEYSSNPWARALARFGWRQPGNLYRVDVRRA